MLEPVTCVYLAFSANFLSLHSFWHTPFCLLYKFSVLYAMLCVGCVFIYVCVCILLVFFFFSCLIICTLNMKHIFCVYILSIQRNRRKLAGASLKYTFTNDDLQWAKNKGLNIKMRTEFYLYWLNLLIKIVKSNSKHVHSIAGYVQKLISNQEIY